MLRACTCIDLNGAYAGLQGQSFRGDSRPLQSIDHGPAAFPTGAATIGACLVLSRHRRAGTEVVASPCCLPPAPSTLNGHYLFPVAFHITFVFRKGGSPSGCVRHAVIQSVGGESRIPASCWPDDGTHSITLRSVFHTSRSFPVCPSGRTQAILKAMFFPDQLL